MTGSSIAAVKAALLAAWQANVDLDTVAVADSKPAQASDLTGETGLLDAVWIADANASIDDIVSCDGQVQVDEQISMEVIVQVIRPDTAGTQAVCDSRAVTLLGEVLEPIGADPTLGLGGTWPTLQVLPVGWDYVSGIVGKTEGHGTRFILDLEIRSRITL